MGLGEFPDNLPPVILHFSGDVGGGNICIEVSQIQTASRHMGGGGAQGNSSLSLTQFISKSRTLMLKIESGKSPNIAKTPLKWCDSSHILLTTWLMTFGLAGNRGTVGPNYFRTIFGDAILVRVEYKINNYINNEITSKLIILKTRLFWDFF
jgi:hypothetical protein